MPVQLEIEDGNPWYLSPDIWVVPGNDPAGAPGIPSAGQASYVWARVHNRGTDGVTNAAVNYYWANPSTTITQNTATQFGTSYVDLDNGHEAPVLCLAQWVPSWVNNGHECLIAEVVSDADPPPPRTPSDPFEPPGERQMAQFNLTLVTPKRGRVVFPFLAGNAMRLRTEEITVRVKRAPIELLDRLLMNIGMPRLPGEMAEIEEFGVQVYQCGDQLEKAGEHELTLAISPGDQRGLGGCPRIRGISGDPRLSIRHSSG